MKMNFDIFICWTSQKVCRYLVVSVYGACMPSSLGMQCQVHAFYARLFTLNNKKIYKVALKY